MKKTHTCVWWYERITSKNVGIVDPKCAKGCENIFFLFHRQRNFQDLSNSTNVRTHAGLLLMTPVPLFLVDGHLFTPTREGKQHCCFGTVCYLGLGKQHCFLQK